MLLQARSPNCLSDHYLLKLDGRRHGEFHGRWFSEGVDVRITGGRRLHLQKTSWLGSHFTLTNASDGITLAEADRRGVLTSTWDLRLTTGPAELVSAGVCNSGFTVLQGGQSKAEVNRIGMCEGGWFVQDNGTLLETDLIFIGLLYHTILKRRQAAASAAAAG